MGCEETCPYVVATADEIDACYNSDDIRAKMENVPDLEQRLARNEELASRESACIQASGVANPDSEIFIGTNRRPVFCQRASKWLLATLPTWEPGYYRMWYGVQEVPESEIII